MATEHPMPGTRVVPLDLPAEQMTILRSDLRSWLASVREDLKTPERMPDPESAHRDASAYERLLAGLDRGEISVPDEEARAALQSAAEGYDKASNYTEVVAIHDALHGLLARLTIPEDERP